MPLQRILYLNFEDERILPLQQGDLGDILEAFYELYPDEKNQTIYLFFDEIQNISGWELFIRRIMDKERARIFLTGSSSKLLSREIASCLRGRTLSFRISPLSFREFLKFKGIELERGYEYSGVRFKLKKALEEFIDYGGYPEVALEDKLKLEILKEYYETIIARDLMERFSLRNIQLLKEMLKYLLTNISSLFSLNAYFKAVSQAFHPSKETLVEYLSYILETEIIHLVPIFSYSLKVQQVNPRKAYSVDNGLRNAVAFKFSKDEGRLVENIVFQELKRRGYDIFYGKDKGEVDFVVRKNGVLSAIDVTYSSAVGEDQRRNLMEFKKHFKDTKELILITKDTDQKAGRIKLISFWKWLLASD